MRAEYFLIVCFWVTQTFAAPLIKPMCLDQDFVLSLAPVASKASIHHKGHLWLSQLQHKLRMHVEQPKQADWLVSSNKITWIDHALEQVVVYPLAEKTYPLLAWLVGNKKDQWANYTMEYSVNQRGTEVRFIYKELKGRVNIIHTLWGHDDALLSVWGEDAIGQRWHLVLGNGKKTACPLPEGGFYIRIPDNYDYL